MALKNIPEKNFTKCQKRIPKLIEWSTFDAQTEI